MKKFLYSVAVIDTVAIAGWNYQQNKEVELSKLILEETEAVAHNEINPPRRRLAFVGGMSYCTSDSNTLCNGIKC